MSNILELKKQEVEAIKEKIKSSKGFVVIDYKGLSVAQDTELRNSFRKAGVEYKVLKNTMVKRALHDLGYTQFDESLNGATSVAFNFSDEVSAAKIFDECQAKFKKMEAKSGLCDGQFIDANGVKRLASIPSREQLYAGIASALIGTVRKLACGIKAVADKRQEA